MATFGAKSGTAIGFQRRDAPSYMNIADLDGSRAFRVEIFTFFFLFGIDWESFRPAFRDEYFEGVRDGYGVSSTVRES